MFIIISISKNVLLLKRRGAHCENCTDSGARRFLFAFVSLKMIPNIFIFIALREKRYFFNECAQTARLRARSGGYSARQQRWSIAPGRPDPCAAVGGCADAYGDVAHDSLLSKARFCRFAVYSVRPKSVIFGNRLLVRLSSSPHLPAKANRDWRFNSEGGLGSVLSHPSRDETAGRMGHPHIFGRIRGGAPSVRTRAGLHYLYRRFAAGLMPNRERRTKPCR